MYPQEITKEAFAKRITIDSICFDEGGVFTVYFGDDDMFWVHSVVVYGDVENGHLRRTKKMICPKNPELSGFFAVQISKLSEKIRMTSGYFSRLTGATPPH